MLLDFESEQSEDSTPSFCALARKRGGKLSSTLFLSFASMYYVYVLKIKGDKLYIGYTSNLRRRLKEHKAKAPNLIYYESFKNKQDATERENQLKKYKSAWGFLKKRIARSRI